MFLDSSKSRSNDLSLSWPSCFLLVGCICFFVGAHLQDACAQQQFQERPVFQGGGQVIQPSTIVQPTQIQPPQNYQGQTQIIPQPLPTYQPTTPGPIYQGRGTIVPNQTAPPIVTIPQPAVDENVRKALEAEKAAYKEAQLEVKKLAERNAALIRQKEGALEEFKSLEEKNVMLTRKVRQLGQANDRVQTTVDELREKLAAAGEDSGGMQEAEELNQRLKTQVETLSTENESFRTKITSLSSDLAAAQEKAMQAKPDDGKDAELQQLTEDKRVLAEDYQKLTQDYQTLEKKRQSTVDENQTLTEQILNLRSSNQGYQADIASLQAKAAEMPEPLPVEEVIEPMPAQPTVDVGAYQSKIDQLTRKNRLLTQSNADFEEKNKLLGRQLASLEAQPVEVSTSVAEVSDSVDITGGCLLYTSPSPRDRG